MGTYYKGSKEKRTALNSYIKLIRCAESLTARLHPVLYQVGLSEGQFGILDALYHIGSLSQKELGAKLLKSGGNITMVVDNLEKRELVKRERNEADRRYFTIHLTTKGKIIFEQTFPLVLKALVDEMKALTDDEQSALQRICKLLGIKS